ncbi:MAG: lipopolysaccharide biosynthesis protein, partial [Ruminococcus sp.]|nr:lipopolysaccharide biosynthesis protein [Candidatus Copronaster equi]
MEKKVKTLRQQVFSGMIWRFMERGCVQVINFVLQIVLARLLEPSDYGTLAILNVFISFSTTLINNGLGNAIIQKKDADEKDFNTIFYIQLGLALILMLILNLLAPSIASYYHDETLSIYLRVMSVILVLEALASIQMTALRKSLQFKKSFYANVAGTLTSGVVGIAMALNGFGCWSLIFSQISMKIALLITYLIIVRWRPKAMFSFDRFKKLFAYSWKLTVAWLIGTLHQNVFSLVIGKKFSKTILGFYDKGQNLPNTMKTTVNETISTVMFSALAKIQNDKEKMKQSTRKMMALTAFIIFPVMAGVAGISKSFVYLFLTAKWAPCIPMMQLFCISFGINIISTTNMQSFNAIGKSDVFMKLEIVKRSLSLDVLLLTTRINIYAVIVG